MTNMITKRVNVEANRIAIHGLFDGGNEEDQRLLFETHLRELAMNSDKVEV